MKYLYVKWRDAASHNEWNDIRREFELVTVETVGILHSERKDRVVVIQSLSEAGMVGEAIAIPKKAIIKRRLLK
jgi:hypothetical protein